MGSTLAFPDLAQLHNVSANWLYYVTTVKIVKIFNSVNNVSSTLVPWIWIDEQAILLSFEHEHTFPLSHYRYKTKFSVDHNQWINNPRHVTDRWNLQGHVCVGWYLMSDFPKSKQGSIVLLKMISAASLLLLFNTTNSWPDSLHL